MSEYQNIITTLKGAPQWQQIMFCASCVERIAPVFRRLGQPASIVVFESGLETVWMVGFEQSVTLQIKRILDAVNSTPEASCDDSDLPEFYAMRSLSILAYALEATELNNAYKMSTFASGGMIDLLGEFDSVLSNGSVQQGKTYRQYLSSAETLKLHEIGTQKESLYMMASMHEPSATLGNMLRNQAKESAITIEHVLPEVIRLRGWKV